jgi:hypothetical protein
VLTLDRVLSHSVLDREFRYEVTETLMRYYFHCIILMSTRPIWIAESFNLC